MIGLKIENYFSFIDETVPVYAVKQLVELNLLKLGPT